MLWLVLIFFFYKFISFDHISAAEVRNTEKLYCVNADISAINPVQPFNDVQALKSDFITFSNDVKSQKSSKNDCKEFTVAYPIEFDFKDVPLDLEVFNFDYNSTACDDLEVSDYLLQRDESFNDSDIEFSDSDFETLLKDIESFDFDFEDALENSNGVLPEVVSSLITEIPIKSNPISSTNHHKPAEVKNDVLKCSKNQEITLINCNRPVNIRNESAFRAAIRQNFREIFAKDYPESKNDSPNNTIELLRLNDFHEQQKMVKSELIAIFNAQHPNEVFNMRNYKVLNWPEGLDIVPKNWRKSDIKRIRENIHTFVFEKLSATISKASQYGLDALGDLDDILIQSWTRDEIYRVLLERFREETGNPQAFKIDWHLLDRRLIPSRYDGIEINGITKQLSQVYKNPEIINNIHFFKSKEVEKPKRKRKIDQSI